MSDYTYAEIMKMQDEAVRRVEEMQKRAQAAVGNGVIKENPQKKRAEKSEPKRVPMPEGWLDSLKEYAKSGSRSGLHRSRQISRRDVGSTAVSQSLERLISVNCVLRWV